MRGAPPTVRMVRRHAERRRGGALLVCLVLLLSGCSGEDRQPDAVTWRNITVQLPDGWYVFENEDTRLSIANADIGPEAIRGDLGDLDDDANPDGIGPDEANPDGTGPDDANPDGTGPADPRADGDIVAMFFTYEPATRPDHWRAFVEQQDGTLEVDEAVVLGEETPSTWLVFEHTSLGIPLREMVAVVPSRGVVALAQPVPRAGDRNGPEIFDRHRDTFEQVLRSLSFGRPLLD